MSPENSQDIVTAVIVAHDGAAWIPAVAHAVASQTRPVQRVVAVDTGSRDRSGAMLTQAFGRGAVFGMERTAGYGAAVSQALRHRAASTHVSPSSPGAREERGEWIWLIHDDSEPAPDALEKLMAGALGAPASAVLGPKVLDWSDRDVLLEAGITIDRACRRITGIEPREVDQGQHDGDRDVAAVSTAGMLIRRDVWEQAGGFDPGMRLFREDIDFCWRVQAAGYRVRLVTDAVVYHVEASARNRRTTSAAPHRRREDRRNALTALLANLPAGPMLSALAGNLLLSTLRTLFFLLAKRPSAALDEAAACWSVAAHPLRLLAARRRRAHGRQHAYARLRSEVPPARSLRKLAEFATNFLSKSLPVDTVGSHHATEDPSDDDFLLTDTGLAQRLFTSPGVLLFGALTVIALVAERSLLGSTPLGGGALVPAWGGVSGLWHEYVQGFHPAGIGTAASTPPYVAVIAVLATVLGGKPWLAVDVILLGCVPLAGLTAFLASGRLTRFVPARVWAALTYALLPAGMGAVATGRLGTAVVLVLAPLAALLAGRSFTGTRRRSRRAAWATAVIVTVATAFVPLVWVVTLAAMAVGAAVYARRNRAAALNAAIVVALPPLLLLPWTLDLVTHPARLFLEAGLSKPGLADSVLAPRSLLLLSPGGPGLPPYWVTGGLAIAAVIALAAAGRRLAVLAGWGVAVIGLLAAAVVSRVAITPPGAAAPVPAWPGAVLAIAGAGLLLAAVAAADRAPALLSAGRWRTPAGLAVVMVGVVACSAPALAAAHWVMSGVTGPVAPAAGPLLPEFVSVSSATGPRARTLVLQAGPHGSVTYTVLRSTDPLIGSAELAMPAAGERALELTVAALTAPGGGAVQDQGRALAGFGIGYVMLPAPVDAALGRLLDGVPGLRPVSSTSSFQLWRVVDTAARVTVLGPDGSVTAVPSGPVNVDGATAPQAGGTLVLAEPAGGWHATLGGHPLTPLTAPVNGWAQGFHLPAGGGSLSITRDETGRHIAVAAEGLALLVVIGLGLPGARDVADAEDEASARGRRGGAGRGRAGGRDRDRDRGRRPSRRARAVPGDLPDEDIPEQAEREPVVAGAAAPGPLARHAAAAGAAVGSRLRGAVPAGARVGRLRRGAGREEPPGEDDGYEMAGRYGGPDQSGYASAPPGYSASPGYEEATASYQAVGGYQDETASLGRGPQPPPAPAGRPAAPAGRRAAPPPGQGGDHGDPSRQPGPYGAAGGNRGYGNGLPPRGPAGSRPGRDLLPGRRGRRGFGPGQRSAGPPEPATGARVPPGYPPGRRSGPHPGEAGYGRGAAGYDDAAGYGAAGRGRRAPGGASDPSGPRGPGPYQGGPGPYEGGPGPYEGGPGPYEGAPRPYESGPGPYGGGSGPHEGRPGRRAVRDGYQAGQDYGPGYGGAPGHGSAADRAAGGGQSRGQGPGSRTGRGFPASPASPSYPASPSSPGYGAGRPDPGPGGDDYGAGGRAGGRRAAPGGYAPPPERGRGLRGRRSAPSRGYDPRDPDGALPPLPPPPPRGSRRHALPEQDQADGPPPAWGTDEEDEDW